MSVILTQQEAQALCCEWQERLRLQDWDVKVDIAREAQFRTSGTAGECRWVLAKKTALVYLLDPVDYPPDIRWEQDHEVTLVHELLHLHGAPFDQFESGSPEEIALEQMIDLTARALVALERQASQHMKGA